VKEVAYHLERSADLVIRLGDGTEESRARMQKALDTLYPYTGELFMADASDEAVVAAGIAPAPPSLKAAWDATVSQVLAEATLTHPGETYQHKGGRKGVHSEHLGYILAEMQFLQRAYPGATW
jgi:ring-1,2-phenylacetyl-CoA epoxidase subunit PaaC